MNRKSRRSAKSGKPVDAAPAGPRRAPSGTEAALWSGSLEAYRAGRMAEAEAGFRALLAHAPQHAPSHHLLGLILFGRGRAEEALASLRRAVTLDPNLAQAHNDLGVALQLQGSLDDAVAFHRRALALEPGRAKFHYNLGSALEGLGDLDSAIAAYRAALALAPRDAATLNNLGNALFDQGRLGEARGSYRAALDAKPDDAEAHSNLLRALNYDASLSPDEVLAAHRGWDAAHGHKDAQKNMPRADFPNPPDPTRRLRIGYVSPDFRIHSVAFFFEPLLDAHDRGAVEIFCYANVRRPDAVTARIMSKADHWLSILGMSDAAAAERIRQDGIDILIDLAGHTSDNRLGLFALKPAPVEATWCGYCNTTGLAAIDWRITDAQADPKGAERWNVERLMRLPHGFLCYAPIPDAGPVASSPAREAGTVTFGSFNALPKITPAVVRRWAAILHAAPGARLLLKAAQLRDRGACARLLAEFAAAGIGPERLELLPSVASVEGHLALYGRVDIALDPFPYNGTATSCEALWMGVPVVSLRGSTHAGRVGASILAQLGLEELVAETEDDYVARAVALAADRGRLEGLRQGLRTRMQASPLMDRVGFARDMEAAYAEMWRDWCAKRGR